MKHLTLLVLCTLISSLSYSQIVIQDDGKIGIGTETPTETIDIRSNDIRIGGLASRTGLHMGAIGNTNYAGLKNHLIANNLNYALRQHFQGATYLNGGLNRSIQFSIGSVEKMRLISNGNFGIGTSTPSELLHVEGDIKATNFVSASDKKLKKDISNFDKGLKELLNLNPIYFKYNDILDINTDEKQIGLLAQELQKNVPEMVQEFTHIKIDGDDIVLSQDNYLQIVESDIKYLLINAIKEQQILILNLQDQINNLRGTKNLGMPSRNEQNIDLSFGHVASLGQNSPNPFNGKTAINYFVPESSVSASIAFYTETGQLIKKEQIDSFGNGNVELDATDVAIGVYTYSLEVDGQLIDTKRMVVNK